MQYDSQYLLFANFQIRLKDFKNIYLNRSLNDVIINAFLALLSIYFVGRMRSMKPLMRPTTKPLFKYDLV